MKRNTILSLMAWMCAAILCCTCAGNEGLSPETTSEEGYGCVDLSLSTPTASRTTDTDNFMVTVTKAGTIIRGPEPLGTIDLTFPVGGGYVVYVESCDATTAEQTNDGWGQKRLVGESEEFRIDKDKTTKVPVKMTVHNASFSVRVHPSWKDYFNTSWTVTIAENNRTLVWTESNAGTIDNGSSTNGDAAYFNLDENGNREITYTIEADGGNESKEYSGTITLSRATNKRLNLKYEGKLEIDIKTEMGYGEENEDVLIK